MINTSLFCDTSRYIDQIESLSQNISSSKISSNIEDINYKKSFFISPSGNDFDDGTIEHPFYSFKKAKQSVRRYKNIHSSSNIIVYLRGGDYYIKQGIVFNYDDRGSKNAPITYSAYKDEKVNLIGGVSLDENDFVSLNKKDIFYNLLPKNSRDKIKKLNLDKYNIFDMQSVDSNIMHYKFPMELYQNNKDLHIARWPNYNSTNTSLLSTQETINLYGDNLYPLVAGEYTKSSKAKNLYIKSSLVNGVQFYIERVDGNESTRSSWIIEDANKTIYWSHSGVANNLPRVFTKNHNNSKGKPTLLSNKATQFGYTTTQEGIGKKKFIASDKLKKYQSKNIYIHGMLKYPWSDYHSKIKTIDYNANTIELEKIPRYGIRQGKSKQAFYLYNLIEELDEEGEYFMDVKNNTLYVYPYKNKKHNKFYLSTNNKDIIKFENTSFLTLQNLTIEMGRGNLINIAGGENNKIINSTLRYSGNSLIKISGKDSGIKNCELYGAGTKSIVIDGGDRTNLTPSNNYVIGNHIHNGGRWLSAYQGAISLAGVGQIIEHNNIENFQHLAIGISGNNHTIQYNNIHNINMFCGDSGAIYGGRDWGIRGHKINYNFFHDFTNNYGESFISAIYFDASLSGNEVIGNIFYNIDGNTIFMNGGRYNKFENNIFFKVNTAYVGTNYASKNINNRPNNSFNLLTKIKNKNIDYQSKSWIKAYPRLAKMPNDFDQLKEQNYLRPLGNIFHKNTFIEVQQKTRMSQKNNVEFYKIFETKEKASSVGDVFAKIFGK